MFVESLAAQHSNLNSQFQKLLVVQGMRPRLIQMNHSLCSKVHKMSPKHLPSSISHYCPILLLNLTHVPDSVASLMSLSLPSMSSTTIPSYPSSRASWRSFCLWNTPILSQLEVISAFLKLLYNSLKTASSPMFYCAFYSL